jgi:hypothetical protein
MQIDRLQEMFPKGKTLGIETRGISDHSFIKSVHPTDPSEYCVKLTTSVKTTDHAKTRLNAIQNLTTLLNTVKASFELQTSRQWPWHCCK